MAINLRPRDFIYPYFVIEGKNKKERIRYFPGVYRFSLDKLLKDIAGARKLGLNKFLLFGIPPAKDPLGSSAYAAENIVNKAVKKIKTEFPGVIIMTDVCLCAYTTHGHCGVLEKQHPPVIDNSETLKLLARVSLSHANAGADFVSPSAMARGQVRAIRQALDKNGFPKVKIMGYSAKFASNFYGPFRQAAGSAPKFGDRSAYQLDYADREAPLKEIENDIKEGADIVMVKPALSYLDVIREAKETYAYPLAAYQTSGEYASLKYGAEAGLWEEKKAAQEALISIKRAGADYIITYYAKEAAGWLRGI